MNKTIFFLLGTWLLLGVRLGVKPVDYREYHQLFAEIEALIADEQFVKAEVEMDTLFQKYEVKFVKDYVIAAQICLLNGHQSKGLVFLTKAMKKGVKIDCLQEIRLLNVRLTEKDWKVLEEQQAKSKKSYYESIDLELNREFHDRYQQEQEAKGQTDYRATVNANFKRVKALVEKDSFPGESIVGIDNQTFANSIPACELGNSKVIVTLLHYDFPVSELGIDRLIKAVQNGNLHPREFATIYNFEKNRISVLYKDTGKTYAALPDYHFNFPFGEISDDLERVNKDRWTFGICRYQVDLKKKAISRNYGMKLQFNYR